MTEHAFPRPGTTGMTLRDLFAGQVLAGICAHPDSSNNPIHLAAFSYRLADAMLAERAKGNRAGG
jgi:hypothetical protein